MGTKLTPAQVRALNAANRSGGVVGFGQHARTITILRNLGYLSNRKDNYGYFLITEAGREALREASREH